MASNAKLLNKFGNHVRELRQARGLSQEALAERCDLDRTYISGIERGKRNVSLENLYALARALDVSLARLFDGI